MRPLTTALAVPLRDARARDWMAVGSTCPRWVGYLLRAPQDLALDHDTPLQRAK